MGQALHSRAAGIDRNRSCNLGPKVRGNTGYEAVLRSRVKSFELWAGRRSGTGSGGKTHENIPKARSRSMEGEKTMPTPISRREVQRLMRDEGAQLVEVLPRQEFEDEHIAGAINIPLKRLGKEGVGGMQPAQQLQGQRRVDRRDDQFGQALATVQQHRSASTCA